MELVTLIRLAVLCVVVVGTLWLERRAPLRPRTARFAARLPRNLGEGLLAAAANALVTTPTNALLPRRVAGGLTRGWPEPLRTVANILLLDLTSWAWHFANHRLPPLWRFHVSHHRDRDLDLTTAMRFHPIEIALAGIFRALQIGLIGPTRDHLRWFDRLVMAAVWFHHSNVRVPGDDRLALLIMTPRLHGIHHDESLGHTNLGTIFTVWDRLAGVLLRGLPQERLRIGAIEPRRAT